METKQFASNFAAPVFFFLSLVFYAMSILSIYVGVQSTPSFIVMGLITFIFGYNCWELGKSSRNAE